MSEEESTTLTLEVEVSDVHEGIVDELREAGAPVEQQLGQAVQPQVEDALHTMYQQGRYAEQ